MWRHKGVQTNLWHRPALVHLFTSAKSFSLQPNSHRQFTVRRSRQILGWYSEDGWTLWAPVESCLASSRRWCSWEDPGGAPEWPGTGARAGTAQFHSNYSLGTSLVWQTLAQYMHFMFELDHTHSKKNGDLKVVWEKKRASDALSWILCKFVANCVAGNCHFSVRSRPVCQIFHRATFGLREVSQLMSQTSDTILLWLLPLFNFHIYLAFLKSG